MAPVTHIMCFKTSASYVGNTQIATEIVNNAGKIDGLSKAYVGFQTEDPSNSFKVYEWTSKSAHETYRQSDALNAVRAACQKVFVGRPSHTFVQFPNTKGIFSAPVTEFVTFTLKKGVTMDTLKPLVTQLQTQLQGTPKFYGSSWAPVMDESNVYHGVLGWASVQAHWDAVSSGPLKEIIDKVKEIADLWLVHATLTPCNMILGSGVAEKYMTIAKN